MTKINKELELEDDEIVAPTDKAADVTDPLAEGEIDPEQSGEDGELDDADLDPFKDKWEE